MKHPGTRGNPFHQVDEGRVTKYKLVPIGSTFEWVGVGYKKVEGGFKA